MPRAESSLERTGRRPPPAPTPSGGETAAASPAVAADPFKVGAADGTAAVFDAMKEQHTGSFWASRVQHPGAESRGQVQTTIVPAGDDVE